MPKTITIPNAQKVYRTRPGNFGLFNPFGRLEWISCRDTFHEFYRPSGWRWKKRGFFYCLVKKPDGASLQDFLNKVETHLHIEESSVVHPTNYPTIVWIVPAKFWIEQRMRAAMLTILLRAFILQYDPLSQVNWLEQVLKVHYLRATKAAALRFFDGYTWYTGKKKNWCLEFDYCQNPKAETLLVASKPKSFWTRLLGK